MMKKLLASLLAMVLALSLAVPAFADGPDGPPAPEDILPISGVLDGLPSFPTGGGYGQEYIDSIKTALGGVPGQIGVMVNGVYVKFPDAAPEVTGGRTMVPVRAIVEALGGEASYDGKEITCAMADRTVTFALGSSEARVEYTGGELPGDAQMLPMDCAPYIKGNRTYVPVRFLSEALGYEVGWDSGFRTAVLLDREAVAARYDEKFTIMNRVQANRGLTMEEGRNYKADVKGNLTLTRFDTLNGNQTYKADLSAQELLNTESASAKLSLKLSDNARADLEELMFGGYDAPADVELFHTLLDTLENLEIIVTQKGLGWLHAAALDKLAGQQNVWIGLDLGGEWGELAFAQTGDATIGSVLAAMIDVDSVESFPTVVSPAAQLLYELYGDDKFTTAGGTSTRAIGVDDLFAVYKDMGLTEEGIAEAKAAFQEFKITMKVDSKGAVDMTCVMQTAPQAGVPGIKLSMDAKQGGGSSALNMTLHIANLCEGKLTLTQTWGSTGSKPLDQPPEGSTVVDPAELLES